MQATIKQTSEVVSGKEYPLAITRQVGRQEIEADGKSVLADALTSFESPLGRSRCYTRALETEPRPEEREENCRRVQEAAARALISQGIW